MSATLLAAGDRVIERPNPGGHLVPSPRAAVPASAPRAAARRTGLVVAVSMQANRRGRPTQYAEVVWDGMRTPSRHAAFRLLRHAED
jgi:hypothetical protein